MPRHFYPPLVEPGVYIKPKGTKKTAAVMKALLPQSLLGMTNGPFAHRAGTKKLYRIPVGLLTCVSGDSTSCLLGLPQ